MDEDVCLFKNSEHCNCVGDNINLKLITETRLEAIKKKGKKRKDDLHTRLETISSTVVLQTHENCINRYTSKYHRETYLNKKTGKNWRMKHHQ